MTALAFVDVETTGLQSGYHEIWEAALILVQPDGGSVERTWQMPVNLGRADARALEVGSFYKRRWNDDALTPRVEFARDFARMTAGAHLVGAVPSFDDAFLKSHLRNQQQCPGWHYHLIDVEALAAGWLAGLPDDHEAAMKFAGVECPPWDSNDLSFAVGVDPARFDRHTAMGDVKWAQAIYHAVIGRPS